MKRYAGAALCLVVGISGCMSGPETGGGPPVNYGKSYGPPTIPGVQGPYGAKMPLAAPYDSAPPASNFQAQMMMRNPVPLDSMQFNRPGMPGGPPGANMPTAMMPRGGVVSPLGLPGAPGMPAGSAITSANFMPGGMPGGVNPGVITANVPPGSMPRGGVMPAQFAQAPGGGAGVPFTVGRTQVKFTRPTGMKIAWIAQGPDGKPVYSSSPIETPGRYNFVQAAIYRLKLSQIEGRPGLELYPTLEVVPNNPKTEAFLAHSAVPVEFTNEDFKQVAEGNYIVKVIYLPDPQFQDAAGTGTDEILSTRLEPGADPIQEALRRGSILLVIRMGNVDQEAPNTPPLNAPPPGGQQPPMMPGGPMMGGPGGPMIGGPGMGRPNLQVPVYGMPGMRPQPGMGMMPPPGMMPPGAGMMPPPGMMPPGAGRASTGQPGAPLNVPSVPLNIPTVDPKVSVPNVPPLPNIPGFPGLEGKDRNPLAPLVPSSVKDAGKVTPEFAPVPAVPASKTKTDVPPMPPLLPGAGAQPMLPGLPPSSLNLGPQSRLEDSRTPTLAQLAEQIATPRR